MKLRRYVRCRVCQQAFQRLQGQIGRVAYYWCPRCQKQYEIDLTRSTTRPQKESVS